MNSHNENQQISKILLAIGFGWVLSTIWLVAAAGWESLTFLSLIVTTAGFPLAMLIIWLLSRERIWKAFTGILNQKNLMTWILVGILYPLVTLLWISFEVMGFTPQEDFSWVTHPALLVYNLTAVLVISAMVHLTDEKARFSKQLVKIFPCGNGRLIPSLIWWLCHLPFIFVNGTAINRLDFPNFWLSLYLLTVLTVSFFISWGNDKERRDISSTAF